MCRRQRPCLVCWTWPGGTLRSSTLSSLGAPHLRACVAAGEACGSSASEARGKNKGDVRLPCKIDCTGSVQHASGRVDLVSRAADSPTSVRTCSPMEGPSPAEAPCCHSVSSAACPLRAADRADRVGLAQNGRFAGEERNEMLRA